MRRRLITPALAILLAACSTSTATRSVTPAARGSQCVSSQLEMRLVFVSFAMGNAEGIVDVRNRSDQGCSLAGYASVVLLDIAGKHLQTKAYDETTTFFQPSPAPVVTVTLPPAAVPSAWMDLSQVTRTSC